MIREKNRVESRYFDIASRERIDTGTGISRRPEKEADGKSENRALKTHSSIPRREKDEIEITLKQGKP